MAGTQLTRLSRDVFGPMPAYVPPRLVDGDSQGDLLVIGRGRFFMTSLGAPCRTSCSPCLSFDSSYYQSYDFRDGAREEVSACG